MAIARSKLIDISRPGWIHCISRCVRRAFLCGDDVEHRKQWVEERLQLLHRCYAVDVAAFAVMANHLHLVVRMRNDDPLTWSNEDVARRWLAVYPSEYLSDGTPVAPSDALVEAKTKDWAWIALRRKRLTDLGWFMKSLKEFIARRANHEDKCTGHFWEGRFTSVPLLDQAALIACMAYVDLNPVRAKVVDRPERDKHTSFSHRTRARQRHRVAERLRQRQSKPVMTARSIPHPEHGLWLTTLSGCTVGEILGNKRLTVDDYLTLVDATGRIIRAGKRGAIPHELAPILTRLDLQVDDWIATMTSHRQMNGSGVGRAEARIREAVRRGVRWIQRRSLLFGVDDDAHAA